MMNKPQRRLALTTLAMLLCSCDNGNRYDFLVSADGSDLYRCDKRTGDVWKKAMGRTYWQPWCQDKPPEQR